MTHILDATDNAPSTWENESHSYPWHLCPLGWWGAATDRDGELFFYETEPDLLLKQGCWWHKPHTKHKKTRLFLDDVDWKNSAMPIPERETELNRLADGALAVSKSYVEEIKKNPIFPSEIEERRKQRIEARLIDVNDTDVGTLQDDDLTWLAKNCSRWHEEFQRLAFVDKQKDYYFPQCLHPPEGYTREQWLQRRRELGLNPEDNQPDWSKAPEGTTHWYPHEGMRGKWFKYDQTYNLLFAWEGIDGWDKRFGFSDAFISNCIPHPEQSKSTEPKFDYRASLKHIVSVLHRDGGNYIDKNGIFKAFDDAWTIACKLARADELSKQNTEPQEQEWNGEGLPPVGEWCEARIGNIEGQGWSKIKPLFFGDKFCVHLTEYSNSVIEENATSLFTEFRPIQSTAERKLKELVDKIMCEHEDSNMPPSTRDVTLTVQWLIDNDMLKDDE